MHLILHLNPENWTTNLSLSSKPPQRVLSGSWIHCSFQAFKQTFCLWPTFYCLHAHWFIRVTAEMSVGGGGVEADIGKCPKKLSQARYQILNCQRLGNSFRNHPACSLTDTCSEQFFPALTDRQDSMKVEMAEKNRMQHRLGVSVHTHCVIPVCTQWLESDVKTACRRN